MVRYKVSACTGSVLAIFFASQAGAQAAPAAESSTAALPVTQQAPEASPDQPGAGQGDIVVTGIRESLQRAAQIKQNAVQVVDSIVAQDIGKLPDPTTAAALQRVPGVQVSNNRNNELGNVRIRGLPDILTTVNGREVFTTTNRTFDLQDMPAEALQRVDVYKSQTADLIEGGLAGAIDLKLNRPFDFRKPTLVVSGRGNYGVMVDKLNPQVGALATDSWDTGIGKIGVLLNGNWSRSDYYRADTTLYQRRSSQSTPFNTPGILIPTILQNFPEQGFIERREANAAVQWQASPALQVYVEGFYTYFRDRGSHVGANISPFTTGTSITSYTLSDRCITASAAANGQFPTGTAKSTDQKLCEPDSITFADLVANQTTQARDLNQRNKSIAGGFTYDRDRWHVDADVSYQTSAYHFRNIITAVGQRLPSLTLVPDNDGVASYTVSGDKLLSPDDLSIRNQLQQVYTLDRGSLFATRADLGRDFDGFLSHLKAGVRYARRTAVEYNANVNTPAPGGSVGTPSEANAVNIADTGLPADYVALSPEAPDLNGGSRFYSPNPEFLLDESKLDLLRAYFGAALGRPAYAPDRQFNSREETTAVYLQGDYSIDLSPDLTLDGVIGGRVVRTDRTIGTFTGSAKDGYTPLRAKTSDRDFLPDVTARLKFANGLQARLGYSKTLRRPDFANLNPAITLVESNNPLVQSSGSAGNPNLKVQKSESFDAALEYYVPHGYISVAGYYRDIKDRVINSAAVETIDGKDYAVTRPRNVGKAKLQGIEVSGQYFLQFLPGFLSGTGVQGAFTYADSRIEGDDPLAGNPLQGVSKYNYTAGLLYEKYGISGRLVYTYRSSYFGGDESGTPTLRPVGTTNLLSYVRAAGRLDFNIGYDITDAIRVDVGGTNILRSKTMDYYKYLNYTNFNHAVDYDETTYSVGLRIRL